jgi:hypothetical protein
MIESKLKKLHAAIYGAVKAKITDGTATIQNEIARCSGNEHKAYRKGLEAMLADLGKAESALTKKEK